MANGESKGRPSKTALAIVALALSVAYLALFRGIPALEAWAEPDDPQDRIDFLAVVAQAVGGAALLISLLFTGFALRQSHSSLRHQQQSHIELLHYQERKECNERFFRSTELLGKIDSEGSRINGIYALEHLAYDSKVHQDQVVEVICSFIRSQSKELWNSGDNRSRRRTTTSGDIDVAVTTLERIQKSLFDKKRFVLNLQGAYLCGLRLENVDLRNADLSFAVLNDALILESDLEGASFRGAFLVNTTFKSSRLKDTDFTEAYWDRVTIRTETVEQVQCINLCEATVRNALFCITQSDPHVNLCIGDEPGMVALQNISDESRKSIEIRLESHSAT